MSEIETAPSRNRELALVAKLLLPLTIFEEEGRFMVSSLALPQHPVCLTGPSRDYAETILLALNLLARVYP